MHVVEGEKFKDAYAYPEEGEPGDEATNILVGRDDVSSEAHWRLGRGDCYVSRAHFVLEVRPPNCHLQDVKSTNGTFLRRSGLPEKRIENEILQDGDCIRVGETVLAFGIEAARPVGTIIQDVGHVTYVYPGQKEAEQEREEQVELICVRCGEPLDRLPSLVGTFRDVSFMCSRCRGEIRVEREQEALERVREKYHCSDCGDDVTHRAIEDGRAAELHDVAMYLCPKCVDKAKEQNAERRRYLPEGAFGGYVLLRSLGKGGMGEVFKGVHAQTGRIAAIKQVLPIANSDEGLLRRFHREISLMTQLVHPNLVRLFEAGQEGDSPFFVSEFVSGGDMSQFVDRSGNPTLAPDEVAKIIAGSLIGLEYFHHGEGGKKDLRVHRDLKPENILICRNNGTIVPKVADFGLAKSYEDHGGTTTKTGEFAGTWMYMPPEQLTDFKHCTPLVDVYAMGVTLYYLISGHSPLADFPTPWEIDVKKGNIILKRTPAQMVVHDERLPVAGRRTGLPPSLCRIVDQAVSKRAVDRQQSAEELRQAILNAL
jgi:predicted SprT family Zn-dependent metalloprotease